MGGMAAPDFVVQAGKIVNPWVLRVAGRVPPWVVLRHVGRKSGTTYRTPLVAFAAKPEHQVLAVLPLPWGSGTDWARNTIRSGSARLTRGGDEFVVRDLVVTPCYEATEWLAAVPSKLLSAFGVEECLVGTLHPA